MKLPHDRDMGGFPGTTCVAALIQDGKMYWGHAGDSRLYLLRDGKVAVRTIDHSVVQQWVESGQITAEEARVHPQRNHITHCLGGIEDVFYMEHGVPVVLQSGDVLLLGSDGLWGPFTDRELVEAFSFRSVTDVLDELIATALIREEGHSDNVTGLAVRWGESETSHDSSAPVSHVLADFIVCYEPCSFNLLSRKHICVPVRDRPASCVKSGLHATTPNMPKARC